MGRTVSTGAPDGIRVISVSRRELSSLSLGVWGRRGSLTFAYAPHPQMASATDARYGQKESSDQNFDYMFKILIIGNSSVGKTSFLFRYADDSFTPAFVSTVGIDFKVKTIYRNDKRIKLQIWVGPAGGPSGSITLPRQEQQPQLCLFLSCLDSLITYWAFMRCLLCTRGYRHRRECPVSPTSALQGWGRGKCWVLSYP